MIECRVAPVPWHPCRRDRDRHLDCCFHPRDVHSCHVCRCRYHLATLAHNHWRRHHGDFLHHDHLGWAFRHPPGQPLLHHHHVRKLLHTEFCRSSSLLEPS